MSKSIQKLITFAIYYIIFKIILLEFGFSTVIIMILALILNEVTHIAINLKDNNRGD